MSSPTSLSNTELDATESIQGNSMIENSTIEDQNDGVNLTFIPPVTIASQNDDVMETNDLNKLSDAFEDSGKLIYEMKFK